MLKIIIPLAGSSELFTNAGYFYPKPLVEVNGNIMIEDVIRNPSYISRKHNFVFIIKNEDAIKFHLDNTLRLLKPECEIIKLRRSTSGALCSVLMAIDKIDSNDNLLILNGDQIIDIDFNKVDEFWHSENVDAGLVTFKSFHPRWSYARIENGEVVQTAEKNPISNSAIAGYYYFKNAKNYFESCFQTIKNDVQIEGIFFISSVINQYVLRSKRTLAYNIEPECYHSFYSPQMLIDYERKIKSQV